MSEEKAKITKTELVWPGKRTKVEPVELPFQTIETINLPRGRRQDDLFSAPQQKLVKGLDKQPNFGENGLPAEASAKAGAYLSRLVSTNRAKTDRK